VDDSICCCRKTNLNEPASVIVFNLISFESELVCESIEAPLCLLLRCNMLLVHCYPTSQGDPTSFCITSYHTSVPPSLHPHLILSLSYSSLTALLLSILPLPTHTQVTVEVRSPCAGRIIETFSLEGDEINVGEPLFVIEPSTGDEAPAPAAAAAPVKVAAAAPTPAPAAAAKAAPAAAKAPTSPPKAAPAAAAAAPVAPIVGSRGETRVKMTRMRLRIAQVQPIHPI
jgi:hypothetical protein